MFYTLALHISGCVGWKTEFRSWWIFATGYRQFIGLSTLFPSRSIPESDWRNRARSSDSDRQGSKVAKLLSGHFPAGSHSVIRVRAWTDIKGVGLFNVSILQYSFPFPTCILDLSETFKMSDINAIRLPFFFFWFWPPYVGDDVNFTLTRGEKWAQHPMKCQLYSCAVY